MPYDLFISYSRRDNAQGRITELVERIQADFAAFAGRPLNPFFDLTEIHGMQDWRHRILTGLRESRLFLACVSPGYLGSEYCEWEFVEYLKHEVAQLCVGEGVAPIYFVEVPGWEDKGFDQPCAAWVAELRRRQHFDLRPWFHEGKAALRDAAVREQMTRLSEQLAQGIRRGESREQSLGNVDTHNPHFIGRVRDLRRLREAIGLGRVGVLTAVHGLGGMGKTALAVEYAHAFAHEYGGGRWQLRCAGKDDLAAVVAELATPLGVKFTDAEKLDVGLQFQRILAELKALADAREPHRCLLILDNVDRPALLEPAQTQRLPAADWLHVVATTRLGESDLFGAHKDRAFLPVDELPEEDALALIESYQPGGKFRDDAEWQAAREIVRLVGGLTLAVEAAAVYLGQFAGDVTCAAFLARLKKEGLEGLDAAAGTSTEGVLHGEKRLGATLKPTLERLGEAEKLALGYAALLAPDHVALPWIRALVANHLPELGRDAEPGYADPWLDLLRRLLSLRLLQVTGVADADGQPLVARVHRLVQELVRRDMTPDQLAARQKAVDELVRARDAALEKTTVWAPARWELDPLDALARLWDESAHPGAAWLLNQVGVRWHHLAEWTRAEPLWRRSLAIEEASFGKDHPNVATRLNNLAQLLKATNRLAEAEPLMRRALAIDEASFGKDHPNVAIRLNNLAQLLKATNRLAEAEPIMRRALAIDEASLGKDHPNVAGTLSNLAELLRATNRLAEAEPLIRRALDIDEATFGKDHPNVATDLNNLAQLLQATNRLAEAEPIMRRVVAILEKSLGADHPKLAAGLSNLAGLLQATNRLAEAEPLFRRALAMDEASFGKDHPNVARDLNNLALLLMATNRLAEAEPLVRRAVESFLRFGRATGHPHPHLQVVVNNYAGLLAQMGRSKQEVFAQLNAVGAPFGIRFGG